MSIFPVTSKFDAMEIVFTPCVIYESTNVFSPSMYGTLPGVRLATESLFPTSTLPVVTIPVLGFVN